MSDNNKLVSVIMSVYNSENTIRESIDSIIRQSYQHLELLIIDDCSTDSSLNILQDYEKMDLGIDFKLYRNKLNLGLTKSLNILIKKSNGEFIARQDSDDKSLEKRIEIQVNEIAKNNLDFCTTRAFRMNTTSKIPGVSFRIPKKVIMRYKNPFIHGTLLIKRTTLDDIGLYDENFRLAQDYKLFSDLLATGRKFKNISTPLYVLNMQNNISTVQKAAQEYFADCVRRNKIPNEYEEFSK
tara:strand:+ start:16286 stop:17005 length:720 start_codon:yes stop_codon:yes gene_type:complete